MEKPLEATRLIEYLEGRLNGTGQTGRDATHGKEPYYPLLVFFLGEDAMAGADAVWTHLMRIWPQYRDDIQFFGVDIEDDESLSYVRLIDGRRETVDEEELGYVMDSLSDSSNHFENHERQLLYYVLGTTSFSSAEDLDRWLGAIETLKEDLYVDELDAMQMLFLLLDMSRPRRKTAAGICNILASRCGGEELASYRIVLLSNLLMGNRFDRSWSSCYRICSALIALSDNSDNGVADTLFDRGIATVGYARQEKPVHDISQVIIERLIEYLTRARGEVQPLRIGSHDFSERLGLGSEGVATLFKSYVDKELSSRLPDNATIELFPRVSPEQDFRGTLGGLTAAELDRVTLGTWTACIEEVAREGIERLSSDYHTRKKWANEYEELLCERFDQDELIFLSEHADDLRQLFTQANEPSASGPARLYAERKLLAMFASDEVIVDALIEVIVHLGRQKLALREQWEALRQSTNTLHQVHDRNLIDFYERKARRFFDQQGTDLLESMRKFSDAAGIGDFLRRTIDRLVESDGIFGSTFDDELKSRLNVDAQARGAQDYIRERLTGPNVQTYLRYGSSLGGTLKRCVLLKGGTELQGDLKAFLDGETYYYDTGYGNAVEVLNLYEVLPQNLLSGEVR